MDWFQLQENEEVLKLERGPSLRLPWQRQPSQPAQRATRGVRRETQRWDELGGAGDSGLEGDWCDAAADIDPPGSTAGSTAAAPPGLTAQSSTVPDPFKEAEVAQQQQKWDSVRPVQQRSYVEHLPQIQALSTQRRDTLMQTLEAALAAVQPCCPRCHGYHMEELEPAQVMYVSHEFVFHLAVPRHRCRVVGCGGIFAPSPFAAACFPATPKVSWDVAQSGPAQPPRWFDLGMLQLLDGLIFQSGRSAAVHSLATVIHRQHVLNGCGGLLGWEHFKRQLSAVLMEYGYLMCTLMMLAKLGVLGLPGGLLAGCPACAGAGPERPLHSICIDFCFELVHRQQCGTAGVQQPPPNKHLFLSGGHASQLLQAGGGEAAAEAERACSDFDAAAALAHTSDKYDVTAVGSAMCRHYQVALLMDIATGERYIYACIMLYTLLVVYNIPVLVVWYDINCRFAAYFLRWAADNPVLRALNWVGRMLFPLPVFHKYCHSAACQEVKDGLYMTGTGCQYSEVNEPFWAYLGQLGWQTQYMTHRNRWGRLERGAQLFNQAASDRTPQLLSSMRFKAEQSLDAAARNLKDVLAELAELGINTEQAEVLLAARAASLNQSSTAANTLPPEAEYALLRLRHEFVRSSELQLLPPAINLFDGVQQLSNAAGSRMQRLGRQLFGEERPGLDDVRVTVAAARLAEFEITRLRTSLMRSAQQVQLTELLIPRLTGRTAEQRKLMASKLALKSRMQPLLAKLQGWLAGGYLGFDLLPEALRAGAADAAAWSLDAICRGDYPWEQSSAATAGASPNRATREQLITRLRSCSNQVLRLGEELALLDQEQQRCISYYSNQEASINSAIAATERREQALLEGSAEVPACGSFASHRPCDAVEAAREVNYCRGLLLLLRQRLQQTSALLHAARSTAPGLVPGVPNSVEYDCTEEDAVL